MALFLNSKFVLVLVIMIIINSFSYFKDRETDRDNDREKGERKLTDSGSPHKCPEQLSRVRLKPGIYYIVSVVEPSPATLHVTKKLESQAEGGLKFWSYAL